VGVTAPGPGGASRRAGSPPADGHSSYTARRRSPAHLAARPPRMEHSVSPPAPRPAFVKGGSETIVVVEGDATRHADRLPALGYRVLRAADPHAALEILESGDAVDLLFSDLASTGPELAARARQLVPSIAVLFATDRAPDATAEAVGLDSGVEILHGPYDDEDLARTIRHALGNQQQVNALAQAVREMQRRRAARRDKGRPLSVLLVEDQDDVRDTSREMLELFDCKVEAVSTAEAAEAALRRAPFDVLLTDISLPGRSGLELARQASRLQPAMQVVLASGYGSTGVDTAALEGVPTRCLPKPYGVPELEALLHELRRA
jgi:CheY-like chemotaxis protein